MRKVGERAAWAGAAGVDWIQIREKDMATRSLLHLVRGVAAEIGTHGAATRIIVNDRLDVALAAGAAGVHLGGQSLPVKDVAGWKGQGCAPAGFLIGASCHSPEAARAAENDGADYVIFGPVFSTPSKLAYGPPLGTESLAKVCREIRIPVLAIGGITLENARACLEAGAAGLAAIRLFQEAVDLESVAAKLRAL